MCGAAYEIFGSLFAFTIAVTGLIDAMIKEDFSIHSMCPKVFACQVQLMSYMETVHRNGDYQCDERDFAAVKREDLKNHTKAVHRNGD